MVAKPVLLNKETHRRTRVITLRGAEFGENVHFVPVIADELKYLILDYPVCLMKDNETGQFGLNILLGFEPGENLYLQGDQWNAGYIPLHVRRQPFMVGLQAQEREGATQNNTVITIDMDSKRVQESTGEALFNEDGSSSKYLDSINGLLSRLMSGIESTKAFIAMIAELDLIEPAQLKVTFANGEEKRYEGLYTVNEEKLSELKRDALQQLHSKGYLQASYLLAASLGHVKNLVDLKNAQ